MKGEAKNEYKKGLWTAEEDRILMEYIGIHGKGKWNRLSQMTGLRRCGKSCRLRWMNYLSPNIKQGNFSEEEDDLIIRLHNLLGNRWSLIAGRVPGRTDNQVKNHWNTNLSKKLGFKKGKCEGICNSSRSYKVTKEKSSAPSVLYDPQQLTENDCHRALEGKLTENQYQDAIKPKIDPHELTVSDVSAKTDRVWFIDNDDMNRYTQDWMNYVDDHDLDFV